MPHIIDQIDLKERRFGQADVVAITGLTAKTLQNWNERGLVPGDRQRPRKGGRRRYTGFEVIILGIMQRVTTLTRLPPADALEIAREAIAMVIEGLNNNENGTGKIGFQTLLVHFFDGQLLFEDDRPANISRFDMIRKADLHIGIPVERVWAALFSKMATRVHGEDWPRENFLNLPAKELRGLSDIAQEFYGLTREDIEEHIKKRRGKRRKSQAEFDASQDGDTEA